jgi:sulfide:quinone oxidoreductase
MNNTGPPTHRFKALIVGGGVAALEAVMALRASAGDLVDIELLTPTDEFHYRPLSVKEPFSYGGAKTYPIGEIAADFDATVTADAFGWVDPSRQLVGTEAGEQIAYDALLLALGARSYPAFSHVQTIDDRRLEQTFRGLVQDIEQGYSHRVAFIAPPGPAWPLPLYELALMTAQRAYDSGVEVQLTLITPEDAPLSIFGQQASIAIAELLEKAGIVVQTSSYPTVGQRMVTIHPGARPLPVERIVALPSLEGPAVRGLPCAPEGFIPVTPYGQVANVARVFAAGDATNFPIKHGGLAAQQADVAAASIAALAGADVTPHRFRPVIRGMLLTGGEPRYLTAQITGGAGFSSTVSTDCPWSPPSKIAAQYLAPYLADRDLALSAS